MREVAANRLHDAELNYRLVLYINSCHTSSSCGFVRCDSIGYSKSMIALEWGKYKIYIQNLAGNKGVVYDECNDVGGKSPRP